MRVTISSSSSLDINKKYLDESSKVLEFLATNNCDLNWGSGSISIMGLCYQMFLKHNRKIYGYTSNKYAFDIDNLKDAKHIIYENTFLLKKNIFSDADFVLFLPGGTGTLSEFLAYLEEVRSNDVVKPLILYNAFGHFDSLLNLISDMVARGFNSNRIYDYFKVANSLDDFKKIFKKINNIMG